MFALRSQHDLSVSDGLVQIVLVEGLTLLDGAHNVGGRVGHRYLALVSRIAVINQRFGILDFTNFDRPLRVDHGEVLERFVDLGKVDGALAVVVQHDLLQRLRVLQNKRQPHSVIQNLALIHVPGLALLPQLKIILFHSEPKFGSLIIRRQLVDDPNQPAGLSRVARRPLVEAGDAGLLLLHFHELKGRIGVVLQVLNVFLVDVFQYEFFFVAMAALDHVLLVALRLFGLNPNAKSAYIIVAAR